MKENIRQEGDEWSDLFPPDGAKDRLKISGTRMRNYRIFSHEMAPKDKLKISGTSLRTARIYFHQMAPKYKFLKNPTFRSQFLCKGRGLE